MINRIGYACINTSIENNFRDCRLNSIYKNGIEFLKEIIVNNLNITKETLLWNIENEILMYRASSKLIPFATHDDILKDFSFRWYEDDDINSILQDIKSIVTANDIRISMHPDQFTVLNSPNEKVVINAVKNLEYHRDLIEAMGGCDLIIHTGGVYGDKENSVNRFISTYNTLDKSISKYLRLENDDISYTLEDVLNISKSCGIPIVLDIHHHNCNNNCFEINHLIPQVEKSWANAGIIPKCHISTGIKGFNDKRHADYISPGDFFSFCEVTKDMKLDLMVEAKSKELATLELKKLLVIQ